MSTLTSIDRKLLEDTLEMSGGYVLNFSSRREFARTVMEVSNCDIGSETYACNGNSMAKRLRAFWDIANDVVTASTITHLLDYAEAFDLSEVGKITKCRNIVNRLTGAKNPAPAFPTKEVFLSQDFPQIDFQKLPIEGALIPIIEERWKEAKRCYSCGAHLSVVILLGSLLEAILLGATRNRPKEFNLAKSALKKDGKVLPLHDWSLANLIDSAREVGLLNEDVKRYSHSLRDFRNYVHPYKQLATQFTPDKDTANISLQVFRAAMNQLVKTSS